MSVSNLARLHQKGKLTFPAALREKLNVQEGDQLEFVSLENGQFELNVITKKKLSDIAGMLKSDIDSDINAARQAVDDYFD
ncbi:AbrB/MazE/SpoVT family DNA-binding domain-containing protein [Paenibacillus sp. 1P07SE]|uniref:AbrB/MazE/SpoVT family DNA-binding domain-containing protein n=1 Tax=Paenibacillus sp. 1P07SE TaxID=3132209 RepID=UPI0039A4445D